METLKIDDRIFKVCGDVPLAVKENRKLFWINNNQALELRCVSENIGPEHNFLFLFALGGSMGEGSLTHYRSRHAYNYKLCLEVTPEKRYAVWNKREGRFAFTTPRATGSFLTSEEAQRWIDNISASPKDRFTIIEFDNPDAE